MAAERDYYSGAFLDWFPGNIQDLNSIAGVLQCPPAVKEQYNEKARLSRESETRHFAAHYSLSPVSGKSPTECLYSLVSQITTSKNE